MPTPKYHALSKPQVFTSSLPLELKETLEKYASKHHLPKNKVIEQALAFFFHEQKRKAFVEGLKKYGHDKAMTEMAEWGMDDYADQLKKFPY